MEQFIREIESYASKRGTSPQALLRQTLNAEWSRWEKWTSRAASPRMETVERLRAYMAANPPTQTEGARQ